MQKTSQCYSANQSKQEDLPKVGHCGMNTRIAWPGDGAYGTENEVLFNEVLWRGLYTLGCELNKKGIYIA